MAQKKHRHRLKTRLVHGRFCSPHWSFKDHIVPPISASAAYRLESVERGAEGFQAFANPEFNRHGAPPIFIYDRLDEPTRNMLEDNLAMAEGSEIGVAFSTGMAAIAASLGVLLKAGDSVVAHHTLYGCTYSLFTNWFPRLGITPKLIDVRDPQALSEPLEDPTVQVVYTEGLTNPTLELLDIPTVSKKIAAVNQSRGKDARQIFFVVDNTFATPWCMRPLELGADLVVHSLTKNIGGFGTDMGGVVLGPSLLEPDLKLYRKDFGAPLAPKAAWPPLVYGLPTLALRAKAQMKTALEVSKFLEEHPKVGKVRYPGLPSHPDFELAKTLMNNPDDQFSPGILAYFVMGGNPETAREKGRVLMNILAKEAVSITLAVSLGQIRTLVEHPSSMTHATIPLEDQLKAGIDPGGIRISFGLEDARDIIADLDRALSAIE